MINRDATRNNPLLQRVRRYATMPVLFRPAVGIPTIQAAKSISLPGTTMPVVQARLAAPTQAEPDLLRQAATNFPSASRPAAASPEPARTDHTSSPAPVGQPVSGQPLVAPITPATAIPPTLAKEEDQNWKRLQAIMRQHQENQAGESETALQEAPSPAAPVQPPPPRPSPQTMKKGQRRAEVTYVATEKIPLAATENPGQQNVSLEPTPMPMLSLGSFS